MKEYKQVTRMEDYRDMQLDVRSTLIANLFHMFLGFIILIYIIFIVNFIGEIEDASIQIIALIVFMFSTVKLLSWCGYPTIEYKPRNKK